MKITSFGQTDVGLVRKLNQDRFALLPELELYIIADGMGGRPAGDVASQITVDAISDFIFSRQEKTPTTKSERRKRPSRIKSERRIQDEAFDDPALLHEMMVHANWKVLDAAVKKKAYRGMGTTVVILLARPTEVVIGYLGDSRAYLHREGVLYPLTQDHSLTYEYIKAGILTPEAALAHPFRHVLSRGVGVEAIVAPETVRQSVQSGDLFLLCTDGLSNMLSDDQINQTLKQAHGDLNLAASTLIENAKKAGGKDNITVVLIDYKQ